MARMAHQSGLHDLNTVWNRLLVIGPPRVEEPSLQSAAIARFAARWISGSRGIVVRCACANAPGDFFSKAPHLLGLRRFGFHGGEGMVRGHCASQPARSHFFKAPQILGLRRFGFHGGDGMMRGPCASQPARGLFSKAPQILGLRRFGFQGAGIRYEDGFAVFHNSFP